ncbi:MAG TPA: PLP-dependent aminotransferase family protein [Stellaceae bacterium]|nr:PLP-dependent aminotransferase family protein [Stellaceae bacterium]
MSERTKMAPPEGWVPARLSREGPRYRAIITALQSDIEEGRLPPGSRLLPHRELADRLGVSVGTVSKAYAEAEQMGLIIGKVGSGTFVRSLAPGLAAGGEGEAAQVSLSLNVPPPGRYVEALLGALAQLRNPQLLGHLFDYLPHEGLPAHREAAALWMAAGDYRPAPADVLICHGAQHAASLAVRALLDPGAPLLAECLTYSGVKALARHQGVSLVGVAIDEEGLIPEALAEACARTGARLLYTMPTLHSPTAAVMGAARRRAIAEIVERHDLRVIEDNVYGFLHPDAPPPLAQLLPDRVFYVTSLSKCVAPGLRVGFVVTPPAFRERMILGLRATAWMATPAMVELGVRMLADGTIGRLVHERRIEARARLDLARSVLAGHLGALPGDAPAGFHLWLPLPADWPAARFFLAARQHGVTVTPPDAVVVDARSPNGVRLCLGNPASRAELQGALSVLRELIETAPPPALSVV